MDIRIPRVPGVSVVLSENMKRLTVRPFRPTPSGTALSGVASGLIIASLIVLFLYVGAEIFEPLAIAALLGFVLSPLIRYMRLWGLGRIAAVLISVFLAISILTALSATIVMQVTQLAQDLPKYEGNLSNKIHTVSGGALTSGALQNVATTLKDLQSEIGKSATSSTPAVQGAPLAVEILEPAGQGFSALMSLVGSLISPLAITALTVLFLVFILLQREDIRDRFLRLAGTADLQRSTAAIDDAASRLSRLFLMQTIVNVGFGLVVGSGLYLIGVPNAVLWGILSSLLRFVPFVGAIIAASIPVMLAAAVDPGWSMVFAAAGLFFVCELFTGNIVEPVLYGQHTGLSPVAIVLATLFWALLWGPIGMLLATPLTVCLVVLGRYIDAFEFIEILLGDEPALEPEERFYQRLLSGNATEAADQAEQQLKQQSLSAYYDSVPMKALELAQADALAGKLDMDQQLAIRDTMAEVVDALDDYDDADPATGQADEAGTSPRGNGATALQGVVTVNGNQILCLASHSPLDEAAAAMLAQLLLKHGLSAATQPFADGHISNALNVKDISAAVICLSYLGSRSSSAQMRYLIRRLKRRLPNTKFVACCWLRSEAGQTVDEWKTAVGADFVAETLTEAVQTCSEQLAPAQPRAACADQSMPAGFTAATGRDTLTVPSLQTAKRV